MKLHLTDKMRIGALSLFALTVILALIGWLIGRDPSQLTGLVAAQAGSVLFTEAANIGKRATYKPEASGDPNA